MSVNKAQRQVTILEILSKKGQISPEELSERLSISMTTLRRDLRELQKVGKIVIGYGFVKSSMVESDMNNSFLNRLSCNNKEKHLVAENALNYVKEDDTLFIAEGSTCYIFTKLLIKNFKRLHIITNDLYSLNALANSDGYSVEAIGGTLLQNFNSFVGPKAEAMIKNLFVKKFFFSCGAYKKDLGTFELSPFSASIKRLVLDKAEKNFLLIDSHKYEAYAPFHMANPEEIQKIITEKG